MDYSASPYELHVPDQRELECDVRKRLVLDLRAGRLVIPPFPRIAVELHRIAQSVEPDLPHACRLIQREVELAGRVVQAACSPVFGGRPVATLEAAAHRLGANGLRDVAMMAAMGKVMRSSPLVPLALETTRHSFVVAVLSQWLCGWLGLDRRQGFLCGLFHDVGRLVLAIALTEYGRGNPRLLEASFVQSTSDGLHAEIGALVLSSWGLHNTVKEVALHHHEPRGATSASELASVVHIADLADRLPAPDADARRAALARHPAVIDANLGPEMIDELATGVDRIRSDEILNSFVR